MDPALIKRSIGKIGEVISMICPDNKLYFLNVGDGVKMFGPFNSRRLLKKTWKFLQLSEVWENGNCIMKKQKY